MKAAPACSPEVRGVSRLPSISFSRAFLCDLEREVTRFLAGANGTPVMCTVGLDSVAYSCFGDLDVDDLGTLTNK